MINRLDIVRVARSYLGTRFLRGGRDHKGIDCVGLLVMVGREVGLDLKDTTAYNFNPNIPLMQEFVFDQSERRPFRPLKNGYLAILKQSVFPMHTGIITVDQGETTIINANMKARSVIEQTIAEWDKDLIEVRDYKGVE